MNRALPARGKAEKAPKSGRAQVRRAQHDDWNQILALWPESGALHAKLWPSFFTGAEMPVRSREDFSAIVQAQDETLYVALDRGQIIGFVYAQLFDTPKVSGRAQTRRIQVWDIVVANSARRRNVGSSLLDAAEAWGRALGAKQSVLTVWEGNDAAALFYQAAEYRPLNHVMVREL